MALRTCLSGYLNSLHLRPSFISHHSIINSDLKLADSFNSIDLNFLGLPKIKTILQECSIGHRGYHAKPRMALTLLNKIDDALDDTKTLEFITMVLPFILRQIKEEYIDRAFKKLIDPFINAFNYLGIESKLIDPESAYNIFITIPALYKNEYAEAQFWIAMIICDRYQNNLTPENFDVETAETIEKKLACLSAMKPHLEAAVKAGHKIAPFELEKLDKRFSASS